MIAQRKETALRFNAIQNGIWKLCLNLMCMYTFYMYNDIEWIDWQGQYLFNRLLIHIKRGPTKHGLRLLSLLIINSLKLLIE